MSSDELITFIKELLDECLNAKENNGVCDMLWRHDTCAILMKILYVATGEEKYINGQNFY